MSIYIYRWGLGFKQSSLGLIARALRHLALDISELTPLPWHAVVPFGFLFQVSQAAQEQSSEFLPIKSGIQRSASRRTEIVDPAPRAVLDRDVPPRNTGPDPEPYAVDQPTPRPDRWSPRLQPPRQQRLQYRPLLVREISPPP